MRVAIVGSRDIPVSAVEELENYLPRSTSMIISGGAVGVDTGAKALAERLGIPFKEFLPDYDTYGKRAPLVRNDRIIEYADMVIALWDGKSKGTQYVIAQCLKIGRRVIYLPYKGE